MTAYIRNAIEEDECVVQYFKTDLPNRKVAGRTTTADDVMRKQSFHQFLNDLIIAYSPS